jgi:hypothetical protein
MNEQSAMDADPIPAREVSPSCVEQPREETAEAPDQATKETPRIIPEPPSRWSFEPETTPKGRGIGCLTIVIAYYILGLLIWQGENWKGDVPVIRTYILAPFAWPAAIAGFVPQKELALRIETALVCIVVYGWLLRDFITAKTRGILWRSAILLGLLFLLSFCGCWAEFGQDMEGVC